MRVITNNPKVKDQLTQVDLHFVDGSYHDVLLQTKRWIIDEHRVLLTHPLSGSIKPNETYYKSIILADQSKKEIDMDSLDMIDRAIHVHDQFMKQKLRPNWTESVLSDFALIDYDLLTSALQRIQFPPTYL